MECTNWWIRVIFDMFLQLRIKTISYRKKRTCPPLVYVRPDCPYKVILPDIWPDIWSAQSQEQFVQSFLFF
jgi:hypothetical protein